MLNLRNYLKKILEGIKLYVDTTKEDRITGAASSITSNNLSENKALISDNEGKVQASAITQAELETLQGVRASLQDQLDGKVNTTNLFVGTYAEYEKSFTNGEIAIGALVIITDDNEIIEPPLSGATSAKLGSAVLGQMILGKE